MAKREIHKRQLEALQKLRNRGVLDQLVRDGEIIIETNMFVGNLRGGDIVAWLDRHLGDALGDGLTRVKIDYEMTKLDRSTDSSPFRLVDQSQLEELRLLNQALVSGEYVLKTPKSFDTKREDAPQDDDWEERARRNLRRLRTEPSPVEYNPAPKRTRKRRGTGIGSDSRVPFAETEFYNESMARSRNARKSNALRAAGSSLLAGLAGYISGLSRNAKDANEIALADAQALYEAEKQANLEKSYQSIVDAFKEEYDADVELESFVLEFLNECGGDGNRTVCADSYSLELTKDEFMTHLREEMDDVAEIGEAYFGNFPNAGYLSVWAKEGDSYYQLPFDIGLSIPDWTDLHSIYFPYWGFHANHQGTISALADSVSLYDKISDGSLLAAPVLAFAALRWGYLSLKAHDSIRKLKKKAKEDSA